jgi:hypothetical protein
METFSILFSTLSLTLNYRVYINWKRKNQFHIRTVEESFTFFFVKKAISCSFFYRMCRYICRCEYMCPLLWLFISFYGLLFFSFDHLFIFYFYFFVNIKNWTKIADNFSAQHKMYVCIFFTHSLSNSSDIR